MLGVEVAEEVHAGKDTGQPGNKHDDKDGAHVNAEGMNGQGFDNLRNARVQDRGGEDDAEPPGDEGIDEGHGIRGIQQNDGAASIVHQGDHRQIGAAAMKIFGGRVEEQGADENDEQKEAGLKEAKVGGAGFSENAGGAKTGLHFSPLK